MWGLKMVRKLDTVHPQPRLKRLASFLLTSLLSAVSYHVFNRLSLLGRIGIWDWGNNIISEAETATCLHAV